MHRRCPRRRTRKNPSGSPVRCRRVSGMIDLGRTECTSLGLKQCRRWTDRRETGERIMVLRLDSLRGGRAARFRPSIVDDIEITLQRNMSARRKSPRHEGRTHSAAQRGSKYSRTRKPGGVDCLESCCMVKGDGMSVSRWLQL